MTRAAPVSLLVVAALVGCSQATPLPPMLSVNIPAPTIVVEDAERFATVLASGQPVTASAIQTAYLNRGTLGVEVFTPYRIENAATMASAIAAHPAHYRAGVEYCLPAARRSRMDIDMVLRRIAMLLDERSSAPVYMVFGSDNSGGTADARALVLGLEVVCRDVRSEAEAAMRIRDLVAHEITHVYQARVQTQDMAPDLLGLALMEGFADFMRTLAISDTTRPPDARARYGRDHERELWNEFLSDMNAGKSEGWMYGPGKSGRPADMGYWIGQRICESYFSRAKDRRAALRTLLALTDSKRILAESGYAP